VFGEVFAAGSEQFKGLGDEALAVPRIGGASPSRSSSHPAKQNARVYDSALATQNPRGLSSVRSCGIRPTLAIAATVTAASRRTEFDIPGRKQARAAVLSRSRICSL
jgi:hypothetical protein